MVNNFKGKTANDFINYFKDVTEEAVNNYKYFIVHDYLEEHPGVDSMVVYELLTKQLPHDELESADDDLQPDAATFGLATEEELFDLVNEQFNAHSRIYAVSDELIAMISDFYNYHFGINYELLLQKAVVVDNHVYINADKIDLGNVLSAFDYHLLGGQPNSRRAVSFFLDNYNGKTYYIAVDEADEFIPGTLARTPDETDRFARDYQLESARDEQVDESRKMDLDEIIEKSEKYAYTIERLSEEEYQDAVNDGLL